MTTSKKKVSVIIPTYNNAKYLPEAIKSVMNQTYREMEIIVINDGSTDDTGERVRPYLSEICYIEQKNSGPSIARNQGITRARGDYIAFLDADDLWMPDKIDLQMDALERFPGAAVSYTRGVNFDDDSCSEPWPDHVYSGWVFDQLLMETFILLSSVIVRADVIKRLGGFDEDLFTAEDTNLYLRIARAHQFVGLEKVLVRRRKHGNNLSDRVDIPVGSLDCLDRIVAMFPETKPELYPAMANAYIRKAKELLLLYFSKSQYDKCHDVCSRLRTMAPRETMFHLYWFVTMFPSGIINIARKHRPKFR